MSSCWIIVPIKAPGACKTRLAGVLTDDQRRSLVARMLDHVLEVTTQLANVEVVVLGPSLHGLARTTRRMDDPAKGLNQALLGVRDAALLANVDRLVCTAADLPLLTTANVRALLVPDGECAIAPDHLGRGTNALSLPLPGAAAFRFAYHDGSLAAHFAEARRLVLPIRTVHASGLANDVDTAADLLNVPASILPISRDAVPLSGL